VIKKVDIGSDKKGEDEFEKISKIKDENIVLKYPYIIKYHESFIFNEEKYVVMEYCNGGNLSALISSYRKLNMKIPEDVFYFFFFFLFFFMFCF
jgi:serine/threonine protein kinase